MEEANAWSFITPEKKYLAVKIPIDSYNVGLDNRDLNYSYEHLYEREMCLGLGELITDGSEIIGSYFESGKSTLSFTESSFVTYCVKKAKIKAGRLIIIKCKK